MSATVEHGRALSRDEYEALPEDSRVEYVGGHLLVNPGPDEQHQNISALLLFALRAVLPTSHRAQFTWEWRTRDDAFIPDLIVYSVSERTSRKRFEGTPALCVEILSTNRRDDLLLKMIKYAAAALPHYWIVDPRERTLTTYVLDEDAFRPTRVLRERDGVVDLDLGVARASVDLGTLFVD